MSAEDITKQQYRNKNKSGKIYKVYNARLRKKSRKEVENNKTKCNECNFYSDLN